VDRAEGAPGRALQLLTSDGVCDSANPAVLARLRELHPQAAGPGLADPLPEDRPDVTPWWATDQLLAMEAVVRSFPPGSAAGPSGLRPQHLLDCLNSADSAAKADLLEALEQRCPSLLPWMRPCYPGCDPATHGDGP